MAETRLHWDDYETLGNNVSLNTRTPLIGATVQAHSDVKGDGLGNVKWTNLPYSGEFIGSSISNTTANQQNQGMRIVFNDGGQNTTLGIMIRCDLADITRNGYRAVYYPRLNGGTFRWYVHANSYNGAKIGSDIIHATTLGEDITFAFAVVDSNKFYAVINGTVVLDGVVNTTLGAGRIGQSIILYNTGGGTAYQALRLRQREVFDVIQITPPSGQEKIASGTFSLANTIASVGRKEARATTSPYSFSTSYAGVGSKDAGAITSPIEPATSFTSAGSKDAGAITIPYSFSTSYTGVVRVERIASGSITITPAFEATPRIERKAAGAISVSQEFSAVAQVDRLVQGILDISVDIAGDARQDKQAQAEFGLAALYEADAYVDEGHLGPYIVGQISTGVFS